MPTFHRHLRPSRKRATKTLWLFFALMVIFEVLVHPRRVKRRQEQTAKEEEEESEYATFEERVKQLKEAQANRHLPPPVAKLQIFNVCPTSCKAVKDSRYTQAVSSADVFDVTIGAASLQLNDPPIPIIGTDEAHRRPVTAREVAEFMAHVGMWRRIFHGGGGAGVFLSCRLGDPLPLLKSLRQDKWFRNITEGGTMGKDEWDVLLLGAGRTFRAIQWSIRKMSTTASEIEAKASLGYAVSRSGADRLLRHVRAYTVPISRFMSAVSTQGVNILRLDGAGLGSVAECNEEDGNTRDSTTFPFYPPLHWTYQEVEKQVESHAEARRTVKVSG